MRVEVLRDKQKGGRPVNSEVGRHMAMSMLLFTEASLVQNHPRHPGSYASLLDVMMELAARNGVEWEDVEQYRRRLVDEYGAYNMCKIGEVAEDDVNDGSKGR